MIELKFRSYDFDRKLMVYYTWTDIIEAVSSTEYVYHLVPDNISDLIYLSEHKNRTAPMEYVGQSDKNDQDIYMYDIIYKELDAPDDPVYGHYGAIGIVEKAEYDMGWRINTSGADGQSFYDYMGMNFSFNEIKVIGNVCENPDLI